MPKYAFRPLPNSWIEMYCETCEKAGNKMPVIRAQHIELDYACTRANHHSLAVHQLRQYPKPAR